MAKQEFLDNFRVARNLFMHSQVQADSSQIDPQALERRLVRSAIWLTPKSVKGFSPDDFAELGPPQDDQRFSVPELVRASNRAISSLN
jgi:hypothetical protein